MEYKKTSVLGAMAPAIVGGLNTIAGWTGIGEGRQDRRQVEQDKKLGEQQLDRNKKAADYEQELKMKMWKDTNYKAQLEQADIAGVSKAAVLGGSGTGTQGASVDGTGRSNAADAASTTNARTGMMAQGMQLASQLALQKAQKENIEADTANKRAGTEQTGATTEGTKLENTVKKETQEATIQSIKEKAYQQLAETGISEQNRAVGAETQEARINKIKQEAIGAMINNEATKSGINLNQARITEIANSIQQRWKELELQNKGLKVSRENMEQLTEAMLWGAGIQATGNLVKGIIDIAAKPKGSTTETFKTWGEGSSRTKTTTTNNR